MYDNYRRVEKIGQIYRAEKLAQAEHYRLVDSLRPVRARGFYSPVLARLGVVLMNIGNKLQERYGELGELLEPPTSATEPGKQTGMVG